MKHSLRSVVLAYWYEALASPWGIYLRSPDAARLKTLLYNTRVAANDPQLAGLSITHNPQDVKNELWIIHAPEAPQKEEPI